MKALVLIFCVLQLVSQVAARPLTGMDWSDRKEYDLVLTIRSQTSPQKRLALLDSWAQAYPKSQLSRARLELYLHTYEALSEKDKMFGTARQMLAAQADDPVGLYWMTVLAPQQERPTPEVLEAGDQAGHKLLASVDKNFEAGRKPAAVSDADWQKQRVAVEVLAHRTIGWVNWQRASLAPAEDEFTICLQKDPGNAEISSWMGIVLATDNKPVAALWHLARASNKDLPTPLGDEQLRSVKTMLETMYASYHGSADDLDGLRKLSLSKAFPPPEFSIDSASVVNARKEELALSQTNPELASWHAIRRQLEAPDGDKYFASDIQGKALPRLHGTVIRATTARVPREIVLAMSDAGSAEVTLKLSTPLAHVAAPGAVVTFQGTGAEFAKEPFGLVVTADTAEIDSGKPKNP